jgi:hypothetical protein
MLKPVTAAVVPGGRLALSNTLPLTGWPMGVVAELGLSVKMGVVEPTTVAGKAAASS